MNNATSKTEIKTLTDRLETLREELDDPICARFEAARAQVEARIHELENRLGMLTLRRMA